jgi:[ribosomal protein S5]-alanine N-acetyltransferase
MHLFRILQLPLRHLTNMNHIPTNHPSINDQPLLETERLIIRCFTEQDAEFIIELLNSPGWLRFIADRNIKTKDDAVSYLQNYPLNSYKKYGFGHYLVKLRDDDTPIGMCGIFKRETLEYPDLGFAFLPGYMGKGYAYEAAAAILKYGKEVLEIKEIAAITTRNNAPSLKLIDRLGMKYDRLHTSPDEKKEFILFKI